MRPLRIDTVREIPTPVWMFGKTHRKRYRISNPSKADRWVLGVATEWVSPLVCDLPPSRPVNAAFAKLWSTASAQSIP